MKLALRKYLKILCLFVFFLSACLHFSFIYSFAAGNIPLSMHNYTSGDVTMAVRYFDNNEKNWVSFGWLSIPAYTSITKRLPTQTSELYFYAVNTNGTVYEGKSSRIRDKKFLVSDAPFAIRDGQKPEQGKISVRHFRHKKAVKGSFTFKF